MPLVYNKRKWAPHSAVYVGRPSPWGNPFLPGEHGTREQCIAKFKAEVLPDLDLEDLIGRDLSCWCWPKPCHADAILEEIERRYGKDHNG